MGAVVRNLVADLIGGRPSDRIGNDTLDVLIIEGAAKLMAGLEVKHLACTAVVAQAGAKDVAILIPTTKHQLVGLGYVEGLAVQLLKKVKVIGNTGGKLVPTTCLKTLDICPECSTIRPIFPLYTR